MKINKVRFSYLFILCLSLITTLHHRKPTYNSFLQQTDLSYIDTPDINYANGPCKQANCEKCISENICQCPAGFAQDPDIKVAAEVKSCQYKQRHQALFFVLELIFFFGVGHFYAGRILYGVLKLLTLILLIVIDITIKRLVLKQFSAKQSFNIAMYGLYFAFLAWQLIDIICIGVNYFKDGKGIPLKTFSS